MNKIITRNLRLHNSIQFKEGFGENQENMYMFIAEPKDWPDIDNPPNPENTIQYQNFDYWKNMLSAKKIIGVDVSNVVDRYNWTANTIYKSYDSTETDFYQVSNNFTYYVVTDEFNVYKCLFNNNGLPSTIKPTGQAATTLATEDGYKWKFMYNITAAEVFKFVTNDYIPVRELSGANGTPQLTVSQSASNGSIDIIKVTNGGTGYLFHQSTIQAANSTVITLGPTANTVDDSYIGSTFYINSGLGISQLRDIVDYNGSTRQITVSPSLNIIPNTSSTYVVSPKITVTGDGIGTTAYSNGEFGEIKYINVITKGSNYSEAEVSITANLESVTANASASAMISPPNGHGYDAIRELMGHNVLITSQFFGDESGTFTTNNDFRTVGIIKAPLNANNTVANNSSYDLTTKITLNSVTGSFTNDDVLVGSTSSANGVIVSFANTNATSTEGILSIVTDDGNFQLLETVSANGTTGIISSIEGGELKPYSGELMYIENGGKISRASDQIEDVKIVFKF